MASNIEVKIKISHIAEAFPFQCHWELEDPLLVQSIKSCGILNPLVLGGKEPYVLLSGHRRYHSARIAGLQELPAWVVQEPADKQSSFTVSVLSNWNQIWKESDRIFCVLKAIQELKMTEKDITELLLPALGVPGDSKMYRQYVQLGRLDNSLWPWLDSGKLTPKGARVVGKFTAADQKVFVESLLGKMSLSSSQTMKIAEWLYDLTQARQLSLGDFLASGDLRLPFKNGNQDSRQLADDFFKAVRNLRLPNLSALEAKFELAARGILADAEDVKIQAPQAFEGEGFVMQASIRNRESLDRILELLKHRQASLNSLFDIML